jgi:hypothetical protein
MKAYVIDLYFETTPDPGALRQATSSAFDVPPDEVAVGWFIAEDTRMAYQDPQVSVVWLQNYDEDGEFPAAYGLAIEKGSPDQEAYTRQLARLTGTLDIAAVMLTQFGHMHLFGPDGSDRIVSYADDDGGDAIRLIPADRALLERSRRPSQFTAGHVAN